ncbi:response regulator [Vacuolonema iberomarrocanum]|uniref:response regulator n=1 Tax=Vacuolonema iberomarrocanum TaxID=3454632 RepID=UPI0019DCEE9B|nr:response regulator [filamentous cyanobacterium LEGE 07170]
MDTGISELDAIGEYLISLERPEKNKMLVVDDEPDNLDLLYRTFRREFKVLRSESGVEALNMLAAEGEVAVIISDQRMPEMKGTEFLSKTVPQFPDTMRIILTGFTDVEDLVDAINSGQVYKYITKPWDPEELKRVVQRAVETYEVQKKRSEELRWAQAQTRLLDSIVRIAHQALTSEEILQEIAIALCSVFHADACVTQKVDDGHLIDQQGCHQTTDTSAIPLDAELKAKDAIAQKTPQMSYTEGDAASQSMSINLMVPAIFQGAVRALVSLQWQSPRALRQEELTLLYLSVQHAALALNCGAAA